MIRLTYIVLIVGLVTGPAYGQHLEAYLELAATQNPRLKAAFLTYQSALQRVPQVGALPDPQLSLGLFLRPMEQMMGNQVAQVSLMQMFPWMGTLGAAKDEASLMAKAKFNAFRDVKSSLFYEVKALWYALYLIEEEHHIMAENIKIMQTLETIAVNRFKSGATSGASMSTPVGKMNEKPMASSGQMSSMGNMAGEGKSELVDVLRTQMAILELENKLHLLADSKRVLMAQFNQLLNRHRDAKVEMVDVVQPKSLPVSVTQLPDSIVAHNPLLKILEEEELALAAKKEMNHKMGFPKIGVGVQYGILQPRVGNTNPMNGRDMIMPMVTMNVPIWRRKYRASVEEVDLERMAVTEKQQDTINDLLVDYAGALKDFKDAERRTVLFQKQTELAKQALNILTVSYGAGGNAFEDVLQMQLQLLTYRLGLLQATVDQNIAVAMLERLMGR